MRKELLIALVAVCGCTPSINYNVTILNRPPRAMHARPPEAVEVMMARPQRPYREVLLLAAQEYEEGATQDQLVQGLRETAGRCGCDGIILSEGQTETQVNPIIWTVASLHGFRAVCIQWADRAAPRPAPGWTPAPASSAPVGLPPPPPIDE